MGLFRSRRRQSSPPQEGQANSLSLLPIDLSKRYDVYCAESNHDRVYENVRFLSIRTFERIGEFTMGLISGFLEIEAVDGSRWLIPNVGIRLICEHGTQPVVKILRHRRNPRDDY